MTPRDDARPGPVVSDTAAALAALEALDVGVVWLGLDHTVRYANRAARREIPFPGDPIGARLPPEWLDERDFGTLAGALHDALERRTAGEVRVRTAVEPIREVRVRVVPQATDPEAPSIGGAVLRVAPSDAIAGRESLAETLDRLEDTVARVRHEINNPLMGVMGNVELALGEPDLPEAVELKLRAILRDAGRIREQVAELRRLKRG